MARVLVTGAAGFLGRHLCTELSAIHEVLGADLRTAAQQSGTPNRLVSQADGISRLVGEWKPEIVVHGAFRNRKSPEMAEEAYIGEMLSVDLPLFEAAVRADARLVLIGSSAVYGEGHGCNPITEECPLRPVTIYGLAKVVQEHAARLFAERGMRLRIARLFNLIGPGQGLGFLLPDWVHQAALVPAGGTGEIRVRHRRTSRDFLDVRDAARAVSAMITSWPKKIEHNVASGEAVSLLAVSERLQRLCPGRLHFVDTEVESNDGDVQVQRGSSERLATSTGWKTQIGWQESVADLWEEFRAATEGTGTHDCPR